MAAFHPKSQAMQIHYTLAQVLMTNVCVCVCVCACVYVNAYVLHLFTVLLKGDKNRKSNFIQVNLKIFDTTIHTPRLSM